MATKDVSTSLTSTSVTSLTEKDVTVLRASLDAYKKTGQLSGELKKEARKKLIKVVHNELRRQHAGISKIDWEKLKMVRMITLFSIISQPR